MIRSTAQHGELPPLREIPGWPGNYVSKCGRHFAHHTQDKRLNRFWERVVGCSVSGYLTFSLKNKGPGLTNRRAHRCILNAWGEKQPFPEAVVDHIDRNRTNNAISNLRWASQWQNSLNRGPNIQGWVFNKKVKAAPYIVKAYKHPHTDELITPHAAFTNPEEAAAHFWACKKIWIALADEDFEHRCRMHRYATDKRGPRMA